MFFVYFSHKIIWVQRTILHIDFDSFFASCEQQFHPELRGKPIGVTAQNGRTCIIAASREAKLYGIKTGTRSWEAKKLYPDIVLIGSNFDKYYEYTKKLLSICKDYSPYVEMFSMDEVFIDLSCVLNLYPSVDFVVAEIKEKIRKQAGEYITVTCGVSHNRLLAKLASNMNKPNGYGWIRQNEVLSILNRIDLTDICGIGDRFKRRLAFLGIKNFSDLQKYPKLLLQREFGPSAAESLSHLAFGVDESEVVPYTQDQEVKSVGRNYCLPHNEYDQRKILQNVFELSEEIGIKLRRLDKKARTVGLYLGGERSMGARKTTSRYIDNGKDIFSVCKYLYDSWNWNDMVRQISIWSSNLLDANQTTLPLFEAPKVDKLKDVIDVINDKFGDHTIRRAYLLYADKLTTKPNGYLADKYARLSLKSV